MGIALRSCLYTTAFGVFLCYSHAKSQVEETLLSLDDPRPVAEAVRSLIGRYPFVITYEDPKFNFAGDSEAVLMTGLLTGDAASRPFTIPKRGAIQLALPESIEQIEGTLQAVLNQHHYYAFPGRFRMEVWDGGAHVIPTAARDENGVWRESGSVLDARITISPQELNGVEMLQVVTEAIARESGAEMVLGTIIPVSSFMRYRGTLSAEDEVARDVLLRVMHSVDERLTWLLLYGPSTREYALNVRPVASAEPTQLPTPSLTPSGAGSSPFLRGARN